MKIESLNNSKVKEWNRLKDKKYRDLTNSFLIEGEHLLYKAQEKHVLKEIIADNSKYEIMNVPFYLVGTNVMKKLSNQASGTNVIGVCQKVEEKEIFGRVVLLDKIQDPGNLGTIIRSCVAFGIDTLVLSCDTVDLYNDKVIRATEGMIFDLNIIRKDLASVIKELKSQGYRIYGTDVVKGNNLKKISFSLKTAIIIGNEGLGMKEQLKKDCDEMINIKINCESLNAAVAASIIFYEVNNG